MHQKNIAGDFLNFEITSKDNAKIKYVKKLISSKSFRDEEGRFVVEGLRLCYDAFLSEVPIKEVYYTAAICERFPEKVREIIEASERSYKVSEEILRGLSDTKTPQGLVCVCAKLDKQLSVNTINSAGKFIILENIQDPANLGTMLRTAEALGLDFVVMSSSCCDIYNAKVLRASMGAVFRVRVLFSEDICAAVKSLQARGARVYAAVPESSAVPVTKVNLGKFSAVAVGNEGNGLSSELLAACDEKITIPMQGRAESLNAAMAAGILMWEMMRDSRE